MFLLNSNPVCELRSAKRCYPPVKVWEQETPQASGWISVITLLEIRRGIERIKPKDVPFPATLNVWFEQKVKSVFRGRLLPVSPAVAERAGEEIAAGRMRGLADCLSAATAFEHRLTLVTRNVADFGDLEGLRIVNP